MHNGGGTVEVAADLTLESPRSTAWRAGDAVDVAIRPENIRLLPRGRRASGNVAKITNHVFLGNISEYYATLPSGPDAARADPSAQHFEVGDTVAVEVDATQCSVFRRAGGDQAG